jgi:GNAT superfamily N-acetyltransferase
VSVIRKMRGKEADVVRQVDALAFGAWVRQVRGEAAQLYRRTLTNVMVCREKDPDGCFVAQEDEDGRIVGFIFSRTWGGVGWFGTFAVLPEYQGRGIGKRLIAASLDYLRRDPRRVIGLETMPASPYNLGLYLRQEFQPRLPTLLLSKEPVRSGGDDMHLQRWSLAGAETRERWLVDLQEATGRIRPGLDYSKEIVSTLRHGLGETVVLADGGTAVGLSVVGLVSGWEGTGAERATVQALALRPDHTGDNTFRALLATTEALARTRGKRTLALTVNSRHTWAVERLLEWGYRVDGVTVRMVLQGTDEGPSTDGLVDLSRWAG